MIPPLFSDNSEEYEKWLDECNRKKYEENYSKFPYKDFIEKCVPEDHKGLFFSILHSTFSNPQEMRRGFLERKIFDESIQMPRKVLLEKMNKNPNELKAMIDLIEDFWWSRGRKSYFLFAVLAIGSNLYNQEEIKNYFKKEGLKEEDYVNELACNWGSDEDIFKDRKLKAKDILNNIHNDIDLLICPDFEHSSSINSPKNNINIYAEKFYEYMKNKEVPIEKEKAHQNGFSFYKNPDTKEIVRVKGVEYTRITFKINYKRDLRPFHIYFDSSIAEFKIKHDLLDRIPFSVLLRHGNTTDLESAFYNGIHNKIFENPIFVKK